MTFYFKDDVLDVVGLPRAFMDTCESDRVIESDEKGGLFLFLTLCSSLHFITSKACETLNIDASID